MGDTKTKLGGQVNRRTALQMGIAIGGLAGLADTVSAADTDADLHAEIEAVLQKTQEIWNSQDSIRLKEVWDTDDPEPWQAVAIARHLFSADLRRGTGCSTVSRSNCFHWPVDQ